MPRLFKEKRKGIRFYPCLLSIRLSAHTSPIGSRYFVLATPIIVQVDPFESLKMF